MPLLTAGDAVLLVVDLQRKLVPAVAGADEVLRNAGRLIGAAHRLGVPVHVTEQNPDGLGATVGEVAELLGDVPVHAKTSFAATGLTGFLDGLPAGTVVVAGCEAHVCVLQTVLGLRDAGRAVAVVADAVGSRVEAGRDRALERMRDHGADVVTTEMVVFEWLGSSENEAFRAVQKLIK